MAKICGRGMGEDYLVRCGLGGCFLQGALVIILSGIAASTHPEQELRDPNYKVSAKACALIEVMRLVSCPCLLLEGNEFVVSTLTAWFEVGVRTQGVMPWVKSKPRCSHCSIERR